MPHSTKILFFLSSFTPVHMVIALIAISGSHNKISVIFLILSAFGIVATLIIAMNMLKRFSGYPHTIVDIESYSEPAFQHIIAYVPAFISGIGDDIFLQIAFWIFYLAASASVYTSNAIIFSPLLLILGWKINKIKIQDGKVHEAVVLSSPYNRIDIGRVSLLKFPGRRIYLAT